MTVGRVWLAAVALCVCVGFARAEPAAADVERVLVLAAGPADAVFADRVRGQVSDLPVVVDVVHSDAPDDSDDGRRAAAERLLRTGDNVGAVVWYAHGKVSVLRLQRGGAALFERSFSPRSRAAVPESRARAVASADLEAAAVVVRFALVQDPDGAVTADRAATPPAVAPAPGASPPRPAPAPTPTPAAPTRIATEAAVGWQTLIDGLSAADQSVLAEASLSYARFQAGAFGTAGGPRALSAPTGAEAELTRQSAGLFAGILLVDRRRVRLAGRVLFGVTAFHLASRLAGSDATRQTEDRLRLSTGAEVRGSAMVLTGRVPVELCLGLGATVVAAAPPIYSGSAVASRLWAVEPRAVVGVGLLFR